MLKREKNILREKSEAFSGRIVKMYHISKLRKKRT